MASISVGAVLQRLLPKFDEELLDYITAIVEEMSLEEKRSHNSLHEVMGPFIVDTGKTPLMIVDLHYSINTVMVLYIKGAMCITDRCLVILSWKTQNGTYI